MNPSNRRTIVLALTLMLVSGACLPNGSIRPAVRDDSLVTRSPCAPPCWQGLVPGQTKADEALSFLTNSELVHGNLGAQLRSPKIGGFAQYWWWAGEKHDDSQLNYLDFDGQHILKLVSINVNVVITVGQLVRIYGIPTIVEMGVVSPPDMFSFGPKGVATTALFYKDRFAVSWFEGVDVGKNPVGYCPRSDALIRTVEYYDQKLADYYLDLYKQPLPYAGIAVSGDKEYELIDGKLRSTCVRIPK